MRSLPVVEVRGSRWCWMLWFREEWSSAPTQRHQRTVPDWRWGPRTRTEPSGWRWACAWRRWPSAWICPGRRPGWPGSRHLWRPARTSSGSARPRCSRSSARSRPARRSTRRAPPGETDASCAPADGTVQPGRYLLRWRVGSTGLWAAARLSLRYARLQARSRWAAWAGEGGATRKKKEGRREEKDVDLCAMRRNVHKHTRDRVWTREPHCPPPPRQNGSNLPLVLNGELQQSPSSRLVPLRGACRSLWPLLAELWADWSVSARPVAPGWAAAAAVLGADSCACAPRRWRWWWWWWCALPSHQQLPPLWDLRVGVMLLEEKLLVWKINALACSECA